MASEPNGMTEPRQRKTIPATDSTDELTKHDQLQSSQPSVELKRNVGLVSGVSLIVGTMIGSGIFISPKGVLQNAGSIGASLCIWAGCGVIAILGSLSYAELGTLIPKSGAEYAYLYSSFTPLQRFLGPIPSFLFAWISIVILKPALVAVICLAFGTYVTDPFFDACGPPDVIVKTLTIAAIVTLTIINGYSVTLATRVQVIFTVAKLLAMAVISISGIVLLCQGHTQYLAEGFKDTQSNPSLLALAFYDGLWSYDGWNNLNFVTEEIKRPSRNLPLAILIAIPLVTVCYLLVNISYFTVMSKEELLASSAVAVTWGERVLGPAAFIIPISVALSTFGAANGSLFTGARLCFVAAREGHLMEILAMVHVKRLTPLPSLVFNAMIAIIMIIPSDIFTLIDFFSFTAWMFYGLTMVSLLILRYTKRDVERPYKVPIVIPILVLLISIYLVIAPIVQDPKIEFLYAFLFVVAGIIFYIPFVYFKLKIPGVDAFTTFFQLALESSPTDYEPAL